MENDTPPTLCDALVCLSNPTLWIFSFSLCVSDETRLANSFCLSILFLSGLVLSYSHKVTHAEICQPTSTQTPLPLSVRPLPEG